MQTQPPVNTNKDAGAEYWRIDDDGMRLRRWATDVSQPLPQSSAGELIIGSGEDSWLQLIDDAGRVSRRHATLRLVNGKWKLRDVDSTNGMMVNGFKCTEATLEPGAEVWIGGVTLIAENSRLIALRMFVARLLGWSDERMPDIDLALRSVRLAWQRKGALVLCGGDKLPLIARALHHRILGVNRPFIVCDPRRERVDENVRAAENYKTGMEALRAAKNGSLCIWSKPLPADFTEMTAALRDPDTRVQLIVCGTDPREAEAFGVVPVVIPPLADRKEDLPRIVEEYAHEITAGLGFERASFPRSDQRWVIEHSAGSLPEIEQAILRILRLRQAAGDRAFAAEMLGMSKSYLNKWVKSRNPPIPKRGQGFNADT